MHVENYLFNPFQEFFPTLPSTQTIKVIGIIFFFELAIKNWAMNMHTFQPYAYFLRPFCRGGGAKHLQAIHRFRFPSLYRVNCNCSLSSTFCLLAWARSPLCTSNQFLISLLVRRLDGTSFVHMIYYHFLRKHLVGSNACRMLSCPLISALFCFPCCLAWGKQILILFRQKLDRSSSANRVKISSEVLTAIKYMRLFPTKQLIKGSVHLISSVPLFILSGTF